MASNRIVVVATEDIVSDFRRSMITLCCARYDAQEIGTVLVDAYSLMPSDDPHAYREVKDGFCEHFSKQHDARDFEIACSAYGRLFDQTFERLDQIRFELLEDEGFTMAFQGWVADEDMAVLLYQQCG